MNKQVQILVYDIPATLKEIKGERTQTDLAKEIGVNRSHLNKVLSGKEGPGRSILKFLGLRKLPAINQYEAVPR